MGASFRSKTGATIMEVMVASMVLLTILLATTAFYTSHKKASQEQIAQSDIHNILKDRLTVLRSKVFDAGRLPGFLRQVNSPSDPLNPDFVITVDLNDPTAFASAFGIAKSETVKFDPLKNPNEVFGNEVYTVTYFANLKIYNGSISNVQDLTVNTDRLSQVAYLELVAQADRTAPVESKPLRIFDRVVISFK